MKYIFKVEDMTCNHCKMRIEKALSEAEDIKSFNVDLKNKIVEVDSELSENVIVSIIDEIGYTAIIK
ncbi:copper resistance protein CopZ [Tepiditoga spiralis]|uniref:Copper resistance protein CopZ n=1 Tax=Tepiditoga spiralis TaxID=2108365 RepID=A0A7G1G693_9BACT|nr:cation transporter [Tepiditoga spiralis]BBE30866.1 copper resistance protein CopZ [Tepiditoga spiralis]